MRNPLLSSTLLLLASCVDTGDPTATAAQDLTIANCTTTAIPNDGLDDRTAIQSALDTKGCAYLPAGIYDISTPLGTATVRRPYSILSLATGRSLFGDGASSILRFHGDAQQQDWYGVGINGDFAQVHDLGFETSTLTNTGEQTHAVRVNGPAMSPVVRDNTFDHPVRTGEHGGDCVQLVGYAPAKLITGARVNHNHFTHCDRSGVAVHSGTVGLSIADSDFHDTGDQDIDLEGTGDITGTTIARNVIDVSPHAQGSTAMHLVSMSGASVVDNTLNGRGMFVYSCDHCLISHNTITRTGTQDAGPVIELIKASSDVTISDNTITRAATASVGDVIHVGPHNSGTPAAIRIVHNALTQATGSNVVLTEGTVDLVLADNAVSYTGSATGMRGFNIKGSTAIRTTGIIATGNAFSGPLFAAISVTGSYAGTGSIATIGNTTNAAVLGGLRCENIATAGMVLGPVVVTQNTWPAPVCGTLVNAGL